MSKAIEIVLRDKLSDRLEQEKHLLAALAGPIPEGDGIKRPFSDQHYAHWQTTQDEIKSTLARVQADIAVLKAELGIVDAPAPAPALPTTEQTPHTS